MFGTAIPPKLESLRVWEDPLPREPAESMAWDHALLLGASLPVLRVYRWAGPCVTCGYFAESTEVARFAGMLPWVRRWTGGGLVRHGEDWAYTLVLPRSPGAEPWAAAEVYRWVHSALAQTLIRSDTVLETCSLAVPQCGGQPGAGAPCFENPVSHDLLWKGQKVGGAGQRRTRNGLLFQGSLQIPRQYHPRAHAVAFRLAQRMEPFTPGKQDYDHAETLLKERYCKDSWNHLR